MTTHARPPSPSCATEMNGAAEFLELLRHDGVVRHPKATLTPLTGGVSSEIYRVEDGDQCFVVKRALAKLNVKADWFADVKRNDTERAFIEYVARFLPDAVPGLRGGSARNGYFTMENLGAGFSNWKQLLLHGECRVAHAEMAARLLGQIHQHSAGDPEAARQFDTTPNFRQLRIEPYLLTTGAHHPRLRALFEAEAARLEATHECLVHGDFSPKNILIKGERMVLLDCEVAWYGDPAFDVAFFLNHLFLKSLLHAPREVGLRNMIGAFWRGYARTGARLEGRVVRLLPLLMLARVDGKSPVEYLVAPQQQFVREFGVAALAAGHASLDALTDFWFSQLP